MKKSLLTISTLAALTLSSLAQGTITADNLNGNGNNHSTSYGLFFDANGSAFTEATLNVELWGGPNAASLTKIGTWTGGNAWFSYGGGIYADPLNDVYAVTGVAKGGTATLQVLAWRGSAASYAAAAATDKFNAWNGSSFQDASTFTFSNLTGGLGTPPSLPHSLDGMPAMQLGTAGKTATTSTLTSSLNPSTYGSSVTFTSTVSPSAASGTVTFKDGATTLGIGALSGGKATCSTSALTIGSHSITAEYAGDSSYNGSTNSPALTQTVNKATPTVTTWPTASGITQGQALSSSTLTGGSASVAGGFAFESPSTVPPIGNYSANVVFSPTDGGNYHTVTGQVTVAVTASAPSEVVFDNVTRLSNGTGGYTNVTSTASTPNTFMGSAYVLKAGTTQVSGFDLYPVNLSAKAFTGLQLTIYVWGSVNMGTVNATTPAFSNLLGTYTFTNTGSFPSGYYWLYEGSPVGSAPGIVLPTPLVITNTTIGITLNYKGTTDGVTYSNVNSLTAFISYNTNGVPPSPGSQVFNGYYRNANTETNGNFTSTLRSLGLASQSLGLRVFGVVTAKTATTNIVTSSLNPSTYGSSVTFTSTVTPSSASGNVTFRDGATSLGTGALSGGVATLTTSALTAGSHSITAEYAGDSSYTGSTNAPVFSQTVNKATPTATLAVNNSPVTYDGTAKAATVAVSVSSTPGAAANILTGGSTSHTAAGIYAVTADFVPTDTNYNTLTALSAGNFVIAQATPGVTSWPTASDITQGQALSASTLTGGSASVAGTFGWETPATVPPVGTNSQSVVFSPTDGANYLAVTSSVTVVVNPAGPVTRQPVQSGAWGDPATWGGTLPGPSDNVVIPLGLTVTLASSPVQVGNLTIAGTLTVPGTQTIQITGNFTNAGNFNPGQGTVEFTGSGDSTLTATAPGTLTFYRLTINKDSTANEVTALSKVKATKKLTVTRGKYTSASDYLDIFIDTDGEMILSSSITISGNFTNAGTFTHNNHGVAFDGGTVQNLSLQVMTWFYDLTVSAGTTLVETETDDNAIVENTLANLGVLRKSQAVAGLTQYYFGLAGRYNSADLELDVTSLAGGDPLTAVQVDRRDTNPPNPPGTNVTGLYWVITPTGSDFVANLTLPHQGWDDPLACRYTGSGWDAVQTSFTPNTVVRAGVTQLSPWAVFGSTNVTETVDGYVYKDSLLSGTVGQYDAGIDTPLPNVTVYVTNSVGAVVTLSTDGSGYFQAGVPAGLTYILVDQSDPDFPTGLGLSSNSYGQGANPASVTVPDGGTARQNVGYLRYTPSLATVASVQAHAVRGLTTVEWMTVSELGTVAYDLQRQLPGGEWLTVNADPVFAWNAINGASYAVSDAGARARQTYTYQIIESLDNGGVWVHGPYAVLVTGEPGEPVKLAVAMQADGHLSLSWAGEAGANYLLEQSSSLGADAVWTEVALPTPEATTITLPAGSGTSCFRLYRLP